MCLISLYYIPPGVGQYIGIIIYRDNSSVTIIDIKKIFQYRNIACSPAQCYINYCDNYSHDIS